MCFAGLGLLVSCGGSSDGNGGSGGDRPFVTIGTASKGGTFMAIGANMAELLNQHLDELGWRKVNAKPLAGSMANMKAVNETDDKQRIDFGMSNASITWFAARGEATIGNEPQAKQDVRNVMTMFPAFGQFVARSDSGITTVADLAGKRLITGPAGAGFGNFLKPVLEAHGVSWSDITPVYMDQGKVIDALRDGTVEAAFLGGAVPHATVTQALSGGDIALLSFDETEIDRLAGQYPFFSKRTIEAGRYPNQEQPFVGINVGIAHILVATDADEDMVYKFVKTIYENREALYPKHPALRSINESNVTKDIGVPFHPSAVKAYRELGIWPQDREE